MESNRRNSIFLAISFLFIIFITILSRETTLTRTVHFNFLWSYLSSGHGKQIILNMLLFVPFGYFLASAFSKLSHPRIWPIITALLVSAAVEAIQFFTYRGMLDCDDLVSNVLGAGIGLLIYRLIGKIEKRKSVAWIMLAAGLIGCAVVAVPAAKSNIDVRITKQFQFSISSVSVDDGKMVLEGECFLYERETPDYSILIDGKETITTVDGKRFRAETDQPRGKVEVEIRFKGFPVMPTGTWINGNQVEYVAGVEPIIRGVPETAVLKAWNQEYDTLVFQDGDHILWLIGTEIDRNTEVIYHIHTNEVEKLPEKRVQYGFDNRGFRPLADEQESNELESIDHYRVFEREIPSEYNVTAIVVGFNTDGSITWSDSFRIE